MKSIKIFLLILLFPKPAFEANINKTLFINRGSGIMVDTTALPSFSFNSTSSFELRNEVITLAPGDSLIATVINNDTTLHGFAVKNFFGGIMIAPGDTFSIGIRFNNAGVFIYYDQRDSPAFRYLGAAGMIAVLPGISAANFFWNFKEHQSNWNADLMIGLPVNWNSFEPDYFTINGLSKPDLQNDSTAVIEGSQGDTLHIFVSNTGLSVHSIHFHGYHLRILYSSKTPAMQGSMKDTFALWPMETLILELVPDKPGMFPVHDHNLLSVTGGMVYDNGMMIMMTIQ